MKKVDYIKCDELMEQYNKLNKLEKNYVLSSLVKQDISSVNHNLFGISRSDFMDISMVWKNDGTADFSLNGERYPAILGIQRIDKNIALMPVAYNAMESTSEDD